MVLHFIPIITFMNKISLCIIALGLLLSFASCKPTEQNYKKAYDAAIAKQKASQYDADLGLDLAALTPDDAPLTAAVGEGNVMVKTLAIRILGDENTVPPQYNVCVGIYKMPTNAKAHAEALRSQGYEAFVMVDGEDNYHTIARSFDSWDEAAAFATEFKSVRKDEKYIGLKGAPVIERPTVSASPDSKGSGR